MYIMRHQGRVYCLLGNFRKGSIFCQTSQSFVKISPQQNGEITQSFFFV